MLIMDRICWIDWSKAIAVCTVVFCHLPQPSDLFYFRYLQAGIITVFFFLSGYLFSIGKGLKDFVFKKLRTLVLPYFSLGIVILLYKIYSTVKDNTFSEDWLRETVRRFFVQDRFWTIWFLACVIVLNVMMYIMVRFLKRTWLLSLVSVALAALGLLYYHFGGDRLPWDVDAAFCAMPL